MLETGHSHFCGKVKVMRASPNSALVGMVVESADATARRVYASTRWITEAEMLADSSIQFFVVAAAVDGGFGVDLGFSP